MPPGRLLFRNDFVICTLYFWGRGNHSKLRDTFIIKLKLLKQSLKDNMHILLQGKRGKKIEILDCYSSTFHDFFVIKYFKCIVSPSPVK